MYRLIIESLAERELAKLERRMSDSDFQHLVEAIENLTIEPRPQGVKKLRGRETSYRIRVGNYRVIYEIRDKQLVVLVVRVSRRNESTYSI